MNAFYVHVKGYLRTAVTIFIVLRRRIACARSGDAIARVGFVG